MFNVFCFKNEIQKYPQTSSTLGSSSAHGPPDFAAADNYGLQRTLCYAIVLPGRKSGFRAGFRPDSSRESIKIGPPAGRAGKSVRKTENKNHTKSITIQRVILVPKQSLRVILVPKQSLRVILVPKQSLRDRCRSALSTLAGKSLHG